MTLKQLIYASEIAEGVKGEDLVAIAARAEEKNRKLGLTGFLVFSPQFCLQLLEGASVHLNQLYAQIIGDERHQKVTLLGFVSVSQRSFPDWGMSYASLTSEKRKIYFRFTPSDDFNPYQLSYEGAKDLLMALSQHSST